MKTLTALVLCVLVAGHSADLSEQSMLAMLNELENSKIGGSGADLYPNRRLSDTSSSELSNSAAAGGFAGYSGVLEGLAPSMSLQASSASTFTLPKAVRQIKNIKENGKEQKSHKASKKGRKLFFGPFGYGMYHPYMWGMGYPYMMGMHHAMAGHRHSTMATMHYGTAGGLYMHPYSFYNPMLSMMYTNPFMMYNPFMMNMTMNMYGTMGYHHMMGAYHEAEPHKSNRRRRNRRELKDNSESDYPYSALSNNPQFINNISQALENAYEKPQVAGLEEIQQAYSNWDGHVPKKL